MKKLCIFLAGCLLVITVAKAQSKIDLFGVSFYYNPGVGLKNAPSNDFEDLKYNVSEIKAFATIPFQLKDKKTTIITGLKWHFVNAPFDDFPNGKSFEANLHSIQINAGVNHKFSDKWGGLIMLRPTLASNFKGGIESDDFFLQGSAAVHRMISKKLKIGAGAGNTIGFGEPRMVFVFLLDYRDERVSLKINAPALLDFRYAVNKTEYGLKAELEGGQYNLSNLKGDAQVIANLSAIKFSRYNIGPTFGWNLNKNIRFEFSAGYSVNRILKTLDRSGSSTNYDLRHGGYLRTGFFFGK